MTALDLTQDEDDTLEPTQAEKADPLTSEILALRIQEKALDILLGGMYAERIASGEDKHPDYVSIVAMRQIVTGRRAVLEFKRDKRNEASGVGDPKLSKKLRHLTLYDGLDDLPLRNDDQMPIPRPKTVCYKTECAERVSSDKATIGGAAERFSAYPLRPCMRQTVEGQRADMDTKNFTRNEAQAGNGTNLVKKLNYLSIHEDPIKWGPPADEPVDTSDTQYQDLRVRHTPSDGMKEAEEIVRHNEIVWKAFAEEEGRRGRGCGICDNTRLRDDFPDAGITIIRECTEVLRCGHIFCPGCIMNHGRAWMKRGFPLRCPECGEHIADETIYDWTQLGIVEDVSSSPPIPILPGEMWCPREGCRTLICIPRQSINAKGVSECPDCQELVCTRCRSAFHVGMTCAEHQALPESEQFRKMQSLH